jgi:hypothetical protein
MQSQLHGVSKRRCQTQPHWAPPDALVTTMNGFLSIVLLFALEVSRTSSQGMNHTNPGGLLFTAVELGRGGAKFAAVCWFTAALSRQAIE